MKMPQKLLREAAETIRDRGWTRGAFRNNNNEVCALGALRLAAFGTADQGGTVVFNKHPNNAAYNRARRLLQKTMSEQLDMPDSIFCGGSRGVMWMNDCRVESGEELAGYMEKAANSLDA